MAITNDSIPVKPDAVVVEAYLDGIWTDISADVLPDTLQTASGIDGNGDFDLIAAPGRMTFSLRNMTGKYYIAGATPLSGWGINTAVRLSVVYDDYSLGQFVGVVRDTRPVVGKSENYDTVQVTCFDWIEQAQRAKIILPSIVRSKRSDEAATIIIDLSSTHPVDVDFDEGENTFSTVFDTVSETTTVWAELGKIAISEWSHLYVKRDGTLRLEAGDTRDSDVAVTTVFLLKDECDTWGWEDGDAILWEDGDEVLVDESDTLGEMSSAYTGLDIKNGALKINQITVTAYPRRVDNDYAVLASTSEPVHIEPESSVVIQLPYVDPNGISRKVAAITDEMAGINRPETLDDTLVTLLHFTADATDSSGNHTWTLNDADMIEDDGVYMDGYGVVRLGYEALGPYCLFGGYATYSCTAPSSADFNFGTGPFTIQFFEARINISSGGDGQASVARDGSSSYPAFLINKYNATTRTMHLYMSSDGANWNIANGIDLGQARGSRWVHYAVTRDDDGFFRAFVDGKLIQKWYSSAALVTNSNPIALGVAQGNYTYTAIDEFAIHSRCLYYEDFTPPRSEISIYKDEDCWANELPDRTSLDLIYWVDIVPEYGTDSVRLTISSSYTDQSGLYVWCQVRGKGVYFDAPAIATLEDEAGIFADNYRPASISQKYQSDTAAGYAKAEVILNNRKTERIDLLGISFLANKSSYFMRAALVCDVGDLVHISNERAGVDGYYYIQKRELSFAAGNIIYCRWSLTQDFEH